MRNFWNWASRGVGVLCVGLVAGCMPHFRDVDSYGTMYRGSYSFPTSVHPMPNEGDPFSFGGIAEATGGLMPRQPYATNSQGPDPRDATASGKLGEIAQPMSPTPDVQPVQIPGGEPLPSSQFDGPSGTTPSGMPAPLGH